MDVAWQLKKTRRKIPLTVFDDGAKEEANYSRTR